jgi:hypothetical protein
MLDDARHPSTHHHLTHADMTDYAELAKVKATEPGIRFTPPDNLFANAGV